MSKKLNKVCICGHFAFNQNLLNGQTIKTKIVNTTLEQKFGDNEVLKLDTHGAKSKIFLLPFKLLRKLKRCKNIIILPAQNGLRIIAPLLTLENLFFKRKLHYVVIGGWLPDFLSNRTFLTKTLKKIDFIYVETKTMKSALQAKGFTNIKVMPNCKDLKILNNTELIYPKKEPYKLCTFSRVMKEKGIEDAIDAIRCVNNKYKRTVFSLDIYGQIDDNQTEWFKVLQKSFPTYVNYNGLVSYNYSVDVLKQYFALIFPTRFFTEGIPGTIIDAYSAGVPVIASKWESFSDIVEDKITGLGYEFSDTEGLKKLLFFMAENPIFINNMRIDCINNAEKFLPKTAMEILFKNIV